MYRRKRAPRLPPTKFGSRAAAAGEAAEASLGQEIVTMITLCLIRFLRRTARAVIRDLAARAEVREQMPGSPETPAIMVLMEATEDLADNRIHR
ncbi:MAG: hypothetical protein LBU26_00835 [Synergistaceae bacterium]|nr:hypothetical protein [Synergistaceae bacterium]